MLHTYLPLLLFTLFAILILALPIWLNHLLVHKIKHPAKAMPYECGMPPQEDSARQIFSIRFFLFACLFILLDIETAFLLPWAVVARHVGCIGWVTAMSFLIILGIGLWYEWRQGALE